MTVTAPKMPPPSRRSATSSHGSANAFYAVSFLFTGSNPVQTGVASAAIDPLRTAVLVGKVLNSSSQPIPGAQISVVGQPQLGSTLSQADGHFDLVVNGGGTVTIQYP